VLIDRMGDRDAGGMVGFGGASGSDWTLDCSSEWGGICTPWSSAFVLGDLVSSKT
jgi:hypothetical protein